MKHSDGVLAEDWRNGGFALYVHWPFCASKCPYCDFNSHVWSAVDHKAWRDALVAQIKTVAEQTPSRTLDSIFFGGGTPSLMLPETVEAIISTARSAWHSSNAMEITLEANPTSVDASRFAEFAGAGVNRVSLGLQSLRDDHLKALGRLHSAKDGLRALDIAQNCFDRVSADFIYARQNQSLGSWTAELQEILALKLSHVSLYQLTIEAGTRFGDLHSAGKLRGLPSEDLGSDMYDLTQELCAEACMIGYETSNHAKAGQESRHNLVYWRYGDYAGVGPGAHGRLTLAGVRHAQINISDPRRWLESQSKPNIGAIEQLTPQEQAQEYLIMHMRLLEGMSLSRYESICGNAISDDNISYLLDLDLLWRRGDRIGTTKSGRPLLNSVLHKLV